MKISHARSFPHRLCVTILLVALVSTASAPPAFGQLFDDDFQNSNWLTTIIQPFSSPAATFVIPGIQCQLGRNTNIGVGPSPLTSRQVCTYYPYPSPHPLSIWVAHLYKPGNVFYDPSTQGALAGLYFSYDLNPPSQSVNYGLLIFQNGRFYKSHWTDTPGVQNPTALWKSISHGSPSALLTAADFQEVSNSGSTKVPDFSCKGSTMTFGYVTGTSSGNHWSKSNLDNWKVDIVKGDPCCLKVLNETVAGSGGSYTYTVQLQNPTGIQINQLTVIPISPAGVTITSQVLPVSIPASGQGTISVTITAPPGSTVTLRLGPFDGGSLCCSIQRQVTVP